MFSELFKSMPPAKQFVKKVECGMVCQSYLLLSKDAFSAKEMAKVFAQALLCHDLCGNCENCKKIELEVHPDVRFYPEKDRLLVEDSKKIVEESFVRPIYADKKIFILQNFDQSTEEAQNKLLKALEEPNENVTFILTTTNLEKVLPTIRSRCFKVEIPSIAGDQIRQLLPGQDENKEIAISLGGGYISKTVELAKTKDLEFLLKLAMGLLSKLSSSREALVWSKRLIDQKANFKLIIELLEAILEESLKVKTDKNAEIRLTPIKSEIEQFASEVSLRCITGIAAQLRMAVRELDYNVNLPLVADNLIMKILEVKYLCK